MLDVREPTTGDFRKALPDVRFEDMAEWYAGTGQLFQRSALQAILGGGFKQVALEGDLPLCFWGASKSPEGGIVWLFATNYAKTKALALHRILKPHLNVLHDQFGTLHAYADKRNVAHHDWLEWLGFEALGAVPLGPLKMPFIHYRKEP